MRTANPALNARTFAGFGPITDAARTMSLQGTVNKTALLLLLVLASSVWTWNLYYSQGNSSALAPWLLAGSLGGFVVAMVTVFKRPWAAVTDSPDCPRPRTS